MSINAINLTGNPEKLASLACDEEHLKKLIVLWSENHLIHHLAAGLLAVMEASKPIAADPNAGGKKELITFDSLADAVKEVTGGIRIEFSPNTYKGHHAVPFMNFTSLSRIVEKFRNAPPSPAVPTDDVAVALDWVDDFIARCNSDDRGCCESVNVLRRALRKN